MKFTVIITEAPYGKERAYSALRFALTSLLEGIEVNIFLLENGVYVAKKEQNPSEVPNYLELLKNAIELGAVVKACGPCSKARGLKEEDLIEGVKLGTMHDLVAFVKESDRVVTF
ncbi:DsrE/DsrF/TusD sulfur relay family protein [Methanocaldococcus sp.]|uniref:DsrE/DsrF/TusD sulfur relay family protein n=1 Tax=Methanocaldococcus sp. TaxID=2152917 RepID=UPI002622ECB4|nr:DsrE/DsrF/TusD sulfur relay family protein [Methanocaldococcus sp.]MCQ6253805.1 DsrE/DsrF/TusD sulfur relay family protein [Methanocaldococcus sp.]